MRMIINNHITGTKTRTAASIVLVPRHRIKIVIAQIAATESIGAHVAIIPKK